MIKRSEILNRYGGVLDLVLTLKTDFHVVENLPRAKLIKLKETDKKIHTTFITDSVQQKKLLDWRHYRLWNRFGLLLK